ncbi:MAG: hypothetical protein B7Z27_08960, partial [Sphingobacteriia bacterium 32-37-4]
KEEANHIKNQLENAINYSHNAVKIIGFIAEKNLQDENFDIVSKDLLAKNEFIDALQLIKDSTIIKTYPLKGNEQTIGYDLRTDNEHVREIMLSSSLNSLHFEGPFNLKQGGVGFVGRYPIIQHDSLWGYSAVVIKKQSFIRLLGLDSTGINETYFYQVKKQQEGKKYIPLFSNNRTDFSTGVSHEQYMPIGDWITSEIRLS